MKYKFRFHRELLADSMKTVVEFETRQELLDLLNRDLAQWSVDPMEMKDLRIEEYGYDKRIDWETFIVTADPKLKLGVFGFTNGDPE